MADGLNKVMVMGNLGADPELRVTQGGQSVMDLNVAVNSSYLDRNRVRQEKTEWVRCTVWGKRAEALAKFLRKGAQVFVEGELTTSSWDDQQGIKRYSTKVTVKNILLGGSTRPRSQPNDPEQRRPSRRDHHQDEPAGGGGGGGAYDDQDYGSGSYGSGGDDDIPFTRLAQGSVEKWWKFG